MHDGVIKSMMQQLISWDALELCPADNHELLIPFVMNDAVESFLKFTGCTLQGELDAEHIMDSEVEAVYGDGKNGLIIRQQSGNIVAIWYESVEHVTHLYQFHLIGHGWRKDTGEEDIRRLVNLACVLHDKRNYMGEDFCNADERRIADLAEFAPVLWYTPINESILAWYDESERGTESALYFAKRAQDSVLEEKFRLYAESFRKGKRSLRKMRALAQTLCKPEHRMFWKQIEETIDLASGGYEERRYSPKAHEEIERQRETLIQRYQALGFEGTYPIMKKRYQTPYEITIRFAEEQPFSVMEEEDFEYRIFSMTYPDASLGCVWKKETSWIHRS